MKIFAAILAATLSAAAFAQTATSVQVGTITTGTTLDVRAGSGDGRSITVTVHATNGALDGIDNFGTPPGGGFGGSAVATPMRVPFRPAQVGGVVIVDKDPKLLQIETPAISLKDTSLKGAIAKLADLTHANLVLGIRGLEQAKIDANAPHTFDIKAGTMKDTLLVLISAAAPDQQMVITTDDSVIQICTQAQADNNVVTKTYYVEDLLGNLPRFVPNQTNLDALHDKPAVPSTQPAAKTYSTNIVTLITQTVRPEIWKVNGGKIGEIATFGNRVTIRAPESVHALLDGPKHYDPNVIPRYVTYGP